MSEKFQQKILSNLELAEFSNQLSLMLGAGISIFESLHLLLEDAQSDEERALLTQLSETLEQTGYFHEAVKSSNVFPHYAASMIQLGEETGTLDAVMTSLHTHYTRESNLARLIRSTLIYPVIMIVMMLLIVLVLLTKIMPIFQQVFLQLGQKMNGFSTALLTLGKTLSHYSIFLTLLIGLIVVIVFFTRKHLPFHKKLQEQLSICRFADGMAIVLKSGLSPEQGLELVATLVENEVLEKKIKVCQELLNEGQNFSEALHQAQIFKGSYARMALIAGKAGVLDEAMSEIASEYEYAVNTKLTNLIAMIEPTLVIVLSLIVGIILFSVMLPLLGVMSGL